MFIVNFYDNLLYLVLVISINIIKDTYNLLYDLTSSYTRIYSFIHDCPFSLLTDELVRNHSSLHLYFYQV